MTTENKNRGYNFQICKGKKMEQGKRTFNPLIQKRQSETNRMHKMAERNSNIFFKITVNVK